MLEFLKRFGLGILYVIAAPFVLTFLVLWMLYALVLFFIEIIKGLRNFFNGKPFFTEFEEDIKAKEIIASRTPSDTPIIAQVQASQTKDGINE